MDTDWLPCSRNAGRGGKFMSWVSLWHCSNTYQYIKAVITQRPKWNRVIVKKNCVDGKQPPAETPQVPPETHLSHLLLKMFDSRRSLVQVASLCCALDWSCCGNMLQHKTDRHLKRKTGTFYTKRHASLIASVKARFKTSNCKTQGPLFNLHFCFSPDVTNPLYSVQWSNTFLSFSN